MSNKLLYFLFLFVLCSCSKKQNKLNNINSEHTISIDLKEVLVSKNLLCNEIIEIQDVVCLDTNDSVLVSDIMKFEFYKNKIYVKDNTEQFFIFDNRGNFINKIFELGRGPNQYSEITDFSIYGDKIVIYDSEISKLLFYDLNGNYLNSKQINWGAEHLSFYNDSILLFSNSLSSSNLLLIYDINRDIICDSFIKHRDEYSCILFQNFTNYKKSIYYTHYTSQILYEVLTINNEFNVIPKYYVDFGKNNLNVDEMEYSSFFKANVPSPSMATIDYFLETDNYIYLSVNCDEIFEETINIYISKSDNKIYYTHSSNKKMNLIIVPETTDSDDNFICIISPEDFNYSDLNIDKLPLDNRSKIKELKDTDNPVLILYKLKKSEN